MRAIALIARQPWCTGRVGMTGVSWGGFNAVQVAMRRPPELHAIVPIHFTTDRYHSDVHYVSGTLQVNESAGWPGEMVAEMGLPPRPDIAGADWVEIWRDRLERTPQWPFAKLAPSAPRRVLEARLVVRGLGARSPARCSPSAAGSTPTRTPAWRCSSTRRRRRARSSARGAHTRPHVGWPGPAIDHRELMARWFDRFLNDVDNGVDREPRLLAYLRDGVAADPFPDVAPGRWRAFTSPGRRRRRRRRCTWRATPLERPRRRRRRAPHLGRAAVGRPRCAVVGRRLAAARAVGRHVGGRPPLALLRHGAARAAARDPRRAGARARGVRRPAGGAGGGAARARPPGGLVGARLPRRAQPHPSRLARAPGAARARPRATACGCRSSRPAR